MMDIDQLADQAVSALANRLITGVNDRLVGLVEERLGTTKTGKRALAGLRENPNGQVQRELTATVVADEVGRDTAFEKALTDALGLPTTQISRVTVRGSKVRGDVAGGNIDKSKRFHIGSIRFGGGGLATLIVVSTLGIGGAGAGVYNAVVATPNSSYASQPLYNDTYSGSGQTIDLDNLSGHPGDGAGDIIVGDYAGSNEIIASAGSLIGPLPAGTLPDLQRCIDAADNYGKQTVQGITRGGVVCVRTSLGAIAAITMVDGGYTPHFNWQYWPRT